MREEIGALLDEGLRPGDFADQSKGGCVAAEIANHVHELGDGVHVRVVDAGIAAVAAIAATRRRTLPSSRTRLIVRCVVRFALAFASVRAYVRTPEAAVAMNAIDKLDGADPFPHLDDEDFGPVRGAPHEMVDEPAAWLPHCRDDHEGVLAGEARDLNFEELNAIEDLLSAIS